MGIRFLLAYESIKIINGFMRYFTILAAGGVILRCMMDIHQCRDQDLSFRETLSRQKKYILAGILILCLRAFVTIIKRYYAS